MLGPKGSGGNLQRIVVVSLAAAAIVGCSGAAPTESAGAAPPPEDGHDAPAERVGLPVKLAAPPRALDVECDPTIAVASDGPALIERDPAVLARFSLERVLTALLATAGADASLTPLALLQQLFDTENTTAGGAFASSDHCDSPENAAWKNAAPAACPRAEGALARSADLLTPGGPDSFVPVALVNRMDLMPSTLDTCGEQRLVFAKLSGRTDPSNRLFLIFEGALPNPKLGHVEGCLPVAQAWASLEHEADPAKRAARLEALFFDGLPGFEPVVHHEHFGLHTPANPIYERLAGQVRISQQMQTPWDLREFHLLRSPAWTGARRLFFEPVTVKNNPVPSLFDPAVTTLLAEGFRSNFPLLVSSLAAPTVTGLRLHTVEECNAGESALAGAAATSYAAPLLGEQDSSLLSHIQDRLAELPETFNCPADDPLTPIDIVNRATTQTCAGCHAPQAFLGTERKLGCGLTFPESLGQAHIDEQGNLSPALTQVFLPRRASVMTTLLQMCDLDAIRANLEHVPLAEGGGPK